MDQTPDDVYRLTVNRLPWPNRNGPSPAVTYYRTATRGLAAMMNEVDGFQAAGYDRENMPETRKTPTVVDGCYLNAPPAIGDDPTAAAMYSGVYVVLDKIGADLVPSGETFQDEPKPEPLQHLGMYLTEWVVDVRADAGSDMRALVKGRYVDLDDMLAGLFDLLFDLVDAGYRPKGPYRSGNGLVLHRGSTGQTRSLFVYEEDVD